MAPFVGNGPLRYVDHDFYTTPSSPNMLRPTYVGPHLISPLPNVSPAPLHAAVDVPVPMIVSREQAEAAMLEYSTSVPYYQQSQPGMCVRTSHMYRHEDSYTFSAE